MHYDIWALGKKRNSIIIFGIVAAFIIGTLTANPVADAASPTVNLLNDLTFGLEAIKNAIDGISTDTGQIITDIAALSIGLSAATETQIDNIETDTGQIITDIASLNTGVSAANTGVSAATETQIDNIETDTGQIITDIASLNTGVSAATETQIDDIETDVETLENNQYVPFKAQTTSGITCDAAGGSGTTRFIIIDGDGTTGHFIVTSVSVFFFGVDSASDIIKLSSFKVDTFTRSVNSIDLIGTGTAQHQFELLGIALIDTDAKMVRQIAALSTGTEDIKLNIFCNAGTTSDIFLIAGDVLVSGWKKPLDTISVSIT